MTQPDAEKVCSLPHSCLSLMTHVGKYMAENKAYDAPEPSLNQSLPFSELRSVNLVDVRGNEGWHCRYSGSEMGPWMGGWSRGKESWKVSAGSFLSAGNPTIGQFCPWPLKNHGFHGT